MTAPESECPLAGGQVAEENTNKSIASLAPDAAEGEEFPRVVDEEIVLFPASDETEQSDETDSGLSNDEFLTAIFAALKEPLRPFVVGFQGNPKGRNGWGGSAWQHGKSNIDRADHNSYFTLAVYGPGDDGYHRREKDCDAIYGVMLDDLGTKAMPPERLDACPPSYPPGAEGYRAPAVPAPGRGAVSERAAALGGGHRGEPIPAEHA